MKNIDIAKTLIAKRGEKGITQDELANFIGVSRASVSKWETGQSYPDIIFLPQLAAYFDISLDELMGYVPQMTDENIRKLYVELSNEFAEKPFDDVLNHCHVIIKKYYACFPLLYQLGMLLINYSSAAQDNEKRLSVITEAKGLFIRVKTLCDSIELKQLALRAEAMCEMMLCNSDKVLALLENEKERLFHPSIGVMLSQSYLMLGKTQQAKITLQHSIFNHVVGMFDDIPPYLAICTDDMEHFQEVCKRTIQMIEVFHIKKLFPAHILPFYLAAAMGYLVYGDAENSLAMLETYTEIATGDIFPLTQKGDNFFTLIEQFQNETLKELPFGILDSPRDEQSIKQDMVNNVMNNPAFFALHEKERFQNLAIRLKQIR